MDKKIREALEQMKQDTKDSMNIASTTLTEAITKLQEDNNAVAANIKTVHDQCDQLRASCQELHNTALISHTEIQNTKTNIDLIVNDLNTKATTVGFVQDLNEAGSVMETLTQETINVKLKKQ